MVPIHQIGPSIISLTRSAYWNHFSDMIGVLKDRWGYWSALAVPGAMLRYDSVLSLRGISKLEPPLPFQLLAVSLSHRSALHLSPNHLTLLTLINNRQTLRLPRIKTYPSSSITLSFTGPQFIASPHQRNYFPCALNALDLLLATPILDAAFQVFY